MNASGAVEFSSLGLSKPIITATNQTTSQIHLSHQRILKKDIGRAGLKTRLCLECCEIRCDTYLDTMSPNSPTKYLSHRPLTTWTVTTKHTSTALPAARSLLRLLMTTS